MIAVIEPTWYLLLSALLFGIGAFGLLVRRNPLIMFMCIELMLNAVEHGLLGITYDEKGELRQRAGFRAEVSRRLALPENRRCYCVMVNHLDDKFGEPE